MQLRARVWHTLRGWLALVAIASTLVSVGATARASVVYGVQVGRFFNETDHTAESMRFYPSAVSVAPGDTLHFSTESFHGVTLLPAGQVPAEWVDRNATSGGTWSVFERDPDEGPDGAKMNLRVAAPSADCGWPGQSPCEFDGTGDEVLGALNSGLALFPTGAGADTSELSFAVTVTADPGTTIYAIDPLHPGMTMRIDVVETFAERSDPDALEAQGATTFSGDRTRATQLHKSYSTKRVKKRVNGTTVWSAWAGVEADGISLRRMYPKKLTIKPGSRVKWVFSKNVYEAHTVTFPRGRAVALAGAFPEIACDVDGDEDPTPDTQPTSTNFPFCPSFGALELDVPPGMVSRSGDGKVRKASDAESSGGRGAAYAPTKQAYELAFPKRSTAAGFGYACAIHEAAHAPMRATVVVKP
jgi:plastocyanin